MTYPGANLPPFTGGTGMGSQLGRLVRLVRKELSEILRDRRTIITLVFMPFVLYPVLYIALSQLLLGAVKP